MQREERGPRQTHAMLRTVLLHFKRCLMKFRTRFLVLTLGSILIVSGCAKPAAYDVSSVFDPLAIFPANGTFAWNDQANHLPDNPELQSLDFDRLLKQVSNEEFGKRGYTNVAVGSPNYWLSYELTIHRWISVEKTLATGTLSLNLVDAKTNNRVWLGFGRAEVLVGLSEEERVERLRLILAEILQKFPPSQRGL